MNKEFLYMCYLINEKNILNKKRKNAYQIYAGRRVWAKNNRHADTMRASRKWVQEQYDKSYLYGAFRRNHTKTEQVKAKRRYESCKKEMKKNTQKIKWMLKRQDMRQRWDGGGNVIRLESKTTRQRFNYKDISSIAHEYIIMFGGET